MSHNPSHTLLRGQTYYYNRRVPNGVSEAFGMTLVRLKLGKDKDQAFERSEWLSTRLDQIWSSPVVRPVLLDALLEEHDQSQLDLLKALEAYLSDRTIEEKPVRLAVDALIHVAGNKLLEGYTRQDARALVAALVKKGNKTATVRRRINSLHAIFEAGYLELDLEKRNPFSRLPIPREGQDVTKRGVFTEDELRSLYEDCFADGRDLRLILPILGETGARLAEVVGLRWQDVDLDEETITITPHPQRRLKTRNSERVLPLVGCALDAVRQLHKEPESKEVLFPRWLSEDGFRSTHASNTLNKYLRKKTPGRSCHCFRHTMRDRLRAVDAPIELIDQIGGWSSVGGVGSKYGHGYDLSAIRAALDRAALGRSQRVKTIYSRASCGGRAIGSPNALQKSQVKF